MSKRLGIIRAGFVDMNRVIRDATPYQRKMFELVYMAGAQHMLQSVIDTFPEDENGELDIGRFEQISAEMDAFLKRLRGKRHANQTIQ